MGVFNTVRSGLNVLFTPVLYGVVASLAIQLATWEKGDRTQDKLGIKAELEKIDTFDFIVVGGGTAGSVVANRLSESYTVLLLEAGGEPNPLVYVPGLASHLVNRPEVDWMHKTVAQKRSSTLAHFKRASWSAGKGLGGSGNLDYAMHLRGSPRDFDNWAKLVNDKAWGYENLLPYFQRHENFLGNTTDPQAHAEGGELTIQLPAYRPLATEFVWAGKELGYPNVDLNGRFTEGFDELYYPIRRGEKQTTYKTFVEPIKRRQNLTIRKFATVSKLLLRKNDNGAYGLEYERHGKKYTVYAYRETILCAGTIQSPKLLLVSGIGPKRHLEDVGVKPLVNLPVGRNLQDHLAVYVGPFFIKEPLSFLFDRDVTAKSFFEYGTYGSGPLTSTGFQAVGLIASSFAKARGEKGWPDLQLLLNGVSVHANYATDMAHAYGLQEETLKKYYKHAAGRHSFHIVVSLGRPYARGEIRLASRNPSSPLIIDPKYLEDPWEFDSKTMVEGVKRAVEIVEGTTKFQNLGGTFTHEVFPGCENSKFRSDEYWECYIRQYTVSLNNPVGTCTMGPNDSPHAVVDSELRVIGANNLRVVDASVMPSIVGGGTQAATVAIAEKGAEAILDYWKKKKPESHDQYDNSLIMESNVKTTHKPPPTSPVPAKIMTTTAPPPKIQEEKISVKNIQQVQQDMSQNQNWQNTLDSIAAFSKSIQQTYFKPLPVQTPATTTTTTTSTTTTMETPTTTTFKTSSTSGTKSPRRQHVQNSLFQTIPLPPITSEAPPPPQTPPVSPPRQIIYALPSKKVYTTIPPPTTSLPSATTYRPTGFSLNSNENVSFASSFNIPIFKSTYNYKPLLQSNFPAPVKIYNSVPNKLIQNIVKKEREFVYRQKPQYIIPTTMPTTIRTTTTSVPTTIPTQMPTTYRPVEIIQGQMIPGGYGYENLVDLPINVEYFNPNHNQRQEEPSPDTTATAPTHTSTTLYPIIPAIEMRNPLETTTTRYITQMNPLQPQHIYLSGLEPFNYQDTSTAFDYAPPTMTTSTSTTSTTHQTPLQSSSEASKIFYVVRKKNHQNQQQNQNHNQQQRSHHQENHQHRERNPQQLRMRRPELRPHQPFLRKPPRGGGNGGGRQTRPPPQRIQQQQHHQMMQPQAQRHMPTFALPPHHYHLSHNQHSRGRPQAHAHVTHHHYQEAKTSPASNRRSAKQKSGNVEITQAISSDVFQQNVLNQLIPIQK
ncbi:Glucose dehydrogenase [FAD, quinone] [Orchesella cincta]|uniref:Glucose dehydrogenase [FAD, quinone] n=1 Tax=Orchesella cincta TaxID=48709 RepID=A0A1D2MBU6_ORCCI|nr:Glucose dehydrogenase [FAD, quinone] [Orchesella cincta]